MDEDVNAYWLEAPETPDAVKDEWQRAEQASQDWFRQMRRKVALHDALTFRLIRTLDAGTQRRTDHRREPRARNVRTTKRRARAPSRSYGDSEPEPPEHFVEVGRLAAASVRLWAHEQRRLARRRLAA